MQYHEPPRFLINGSWPGLHDAIAKFSPQPRIYDWAFLGQVTHERRYQCVEQLKKLPNGYLLETAGFTQGIPRDEYYKILLSSKIIPCPSGPVELATARIFEAIECGCLPVVDGKTPHPEYWNAPAPGYWNWFFNGEPPFSVIYDWKELPKFLDKALPCYEEAAKICRDRWNKWKKDVFWRLMKDVRDLRGDEWPLQTLPY